MFPQKERAALPVRLWFLVDFGESSYISGFSGEHGLGSCPYLTVVERTVDDELLVGLAVTRNVYELILTALEVTVFCTADYLGLLFLGYLRTYRVLGIDVDDIVSNDYH